MGSIRLDIILTPYHNKGTAGPMQDCEPRNKLPKVPSLLSKKGANGSVKAFTRASAGPNQATQWALSHPIRVIRSQQHEPHPC